MMNDSDSSYASSAICHMAEVLRQEWGMAALEVQRPSVLFKPSLSRDGNMWIALLGENLQEGVSGAGATPGEAMQAFDIAWWNEAGAYTQPKKGEAA